MIRQLHS